MASKVSVVGIVAWVLVVVLAIGAGALGFLFKSESGRSASWQDALRQVAATAGVAELPAGGGTRALAAGLAGGIGTLRTVTAS